jgi:hypothetical protein
MSGRADHGKSGNAPKSRPARANIPDIAGPAKGAMWPTAEVVALLADGMLPKDESAANERNRRGRARSRLRDHLGRGCIVECGPGWFKATEVIAWLRKHCAAEFGRLQHSSTPAGAAPVRFGSAHAGAKSSSATVGIARRTFAEVAARVVELEKELADERQARRDDQLRAAERGRNQTRKATEAKAALKKPK